jgi:hypothetical protein
MITLRLVVFAVALEVDGVPYAWLGFPLGVCFPRFVAWLEAGVQDL